MDSGIAASVILLSGCMVAIYIFIAWLQGNRSQKGKVSTSSLGSPRFERPSGGEQHGLSPFKCRFCGFSDENMSEGEPFCPRCEKSQI